MRKTFARRSVFNLRAWCNRMQVFSFGSGRITSGVEKLNLNTMDLINWQVAAYNSEPKLGFVGNTMIFAHSFDMAYLLPGLNRWTDGFETEPVNVFRSISLGKGPADVESSLRLFEDRAINAFPFSKCFSYLIYKNKKGAKLFCRSKRGQGKLVPLPPIYAGLSAMDIWFMPFFYMQHLLHSSHKAAF